MTRKRLTVEQRAAARAGRERMMARARDRGRVGRYLLQTLILAPVIGLVRLLPVDVASRFGALVGRTVVARLVNRADVTRTMRVPFPDLTESEVDALVVGLSENIGQVVAESIHLGAFSGVSNPRLKLIGTEHVDAARAIGKGIIFVGGHFANWELFEVALANLGLDGAKVMQHPSNPFVLQAIAHQRYAYGLDEQIAAGEGVFTRVRETVRAGRVVQMLADQQPAKGAKVEFFGLETTTNIVPARVARETGAPIVLMSMKRPGPARFDVTFHAPRSFGPADDEVAIMRWVNAFYEQELRAAPAHWLWGHPRWSDVFENRPAQPLVTPPAGS